MNIIIMTSVNYTHSLSSTPLNSTHSHSLSYTLFNTHSLTCTLNSHSALTHQPIHLHSRPLTLTLSHTLSTPYSALTHLPIHLHSKP